MIKLLTDTRKVFGICFLAILFFSVISFLSKESGWICFQRAGSILTIAGILLTTRPLLRLGIDELIRRNNTIDGGGFIPTPEEQEDEKQERLDAKATQKGVWMMIFGTLIWGYGDLLKLFF